MRVFNAIERDGLNYFSERLSQFAVRLKCGKGSSKYEESRIVLVPSSSSLISHVLLGNPLTFITPVDSYVKSRCWIRELNLPPSAILLCCFHRVGVTELLNVLWGSQKGMFSKGNLENCRNRGVTETKISLEVFAGKEERIHHCPHFHFGPFKNHSSGH